MVNETVQNQPVFMETGETSLARFKNTPSVPFYKLFSVWALELRKVEKVACSENEEERDRVEMYWEEKKLSREVRMTYNLRNFEESRVTYNLGQRE